jgi:hypothetical protein
MSEKRSQEQQTCDLSLKFFPSPSTRTSHSAKKWVVSPQVTIASGASQRSACCYVQCDCACK